MPEEKRKAARHTLQMDERERVRISGVLDVMSFDEEGIMMETASGVLWLKGNGLHMGKLDLESGDVQVEGMVDSITYSDGAFAEKHSILSKLFR
ncbi:MAG: sporulation protein YabP [Anaerotignum sp.]|nr:sporulation protein YabP [Anaerotignum sp.]MBR5590423.1 sporulation protein YabP [Anaerotignum sp.]MBR6541724.1 sporulation protein YabP [Anaerotignum sp.]